MRAGAPPSGRIAVMRPPPARPLPSRLPARLLGVLPHLGDLDQPALIFGTCLLRLLLGVRPARYEILTPLSPDVLLTRFPEAIALHPDRGILLFPIPGGSAALHTLLPGRSVLERLTEQDFSLHAIGWDPCQHVLVDPQRGMEDLAAGVLRAPGSAPKRFQEFPLRALRAARLCAQLSLEPTADVLSAMRAVAPRLARAHRSHLRGEIEALLLGPHVRSALELLRRSGLEASLVPGVADDAHRVVERLPAEAGIRMAGWLRGTRAQRILRHMGQPNARIERVEALLLRHPIDTQGGDSGRLGRIARLPHGLREDLFTLRAAEIEARAEGSSARSALKHFREHVEARERDAQEARRRLSLALDGVAVMEQLGTGSGPRVGAALRYLARKVTENPTCNEPAKLRALLEAWDGED